MSRQGLSIGETASPFTLPGTDGHDHDLVSDDPAPATVVYWTCNHCPYALAWQGRLDDVSRDYADRGVRVLAVNSNNAETHPADSFESMADRVEREGGWPNPYLHDESQSVARAFGAKKTPDVFLLDRGLRLRYRGAPDPDYDDPGQDASWLRTAIDAVLEGREPDPAETAPVGCGIKWKLGA